ncbi:MAG: UDP-N-acetylmuramate dehydrogenase [Candidatus Omnitrophota bacterium]
MKIEENKSLKALNTFGIEVAAKYFVEIHSVGELQELLHDPRFLVGKKLVLGGGSNILLTGNFDGWVIKNAIPGVEIVSETGTEVILKAGAGKDWHDLVSGCIELNYGGLENLSLIPGLVGAAPIQNIGAYGAELKDVFHELEAVELASGNLVKFSAKDCAFGYRDSIFKHKLAGQFFITSVSFRLTKLSAPGVHYIFLTEYGDVQAALDAMGVQNLSLQAVSDAVCQIRRAKLPDPKELGNAGSFFKNPSIPQEQYDKLAAKYLHMPHYSQQDGTVKVPAGWLVEQCGWKGQVFGKMGCHKTQALVIVNYGGATGREILELAKAVAASVKEKFGIELSYEVNIV